METEITPARRWVGKAVRRKEDPRFFLGKARYIDDIVLEGMLYVSFLRSPYAHAKIVNVDASKASAQNGVIRIFTGPELPDFTEPLPSSSQVPTSGKPKRYALALNKTLYVGEPVVAVLASTREASKDALDFVHVDYSPLPAVVDATKALQPGSPVLIDELGTNLWFHHEIEHGDLEAAFASADETIEAKLTIGRQAGVPMEPRGIIATPNEKGLTIWSATQTPHFMRDDIASTLRLPPEDVRVIAPDVGGGFGTKGNAYPEDIVASLSAFLTKKPVKWIEERRENLQASYHARQQDHFVRVAVKRDGTILGFTDRFIANLGAPGYHNALPPLVTSSLLLGNYRIKNFRIQAEGALTNLAPVGPVRGNGRNEATFVIERVLEMIARRLKIDAFEVRAKNLIHREEFPYETGTGLTYDSGSYENILDLGEQKIHYKDWRAKQEELRQGGRLLGIGIACYIEPGARGGKDYAKVGVDSSGKVTVLTGVSPHGQSLETTLAQICAEVLGVELQDISVIHSDTKTIPFGAGTFGSRSAAIGGTAVYGAASKLRSRALRAASSLLGVEESRIRVDGSVFADPATGKSIDISKVASALEKNGEKLEQEEYFEPEGLTFSSGLHAAVVEVDVETGIIKILRYLVVDDSGTEINPLVVDGQLHGGVAHGLGHALLEELIYDESGQLLNPTLMEYHIPSATEIPRLDVIHLHTPSPLTAFGIKGVGEGGALAPAPVIANAVSDALSHLGLEVNELPITPEVIWKLAKKASYK